MKIHESYDHEYSTFFNYDAVDKMVLRKNKNEIYYVRENGETGIKVNKWVEINGEKYVLQWPKTLRYRVSTFDDSSYKETVIYRGNVYTIAGLRLVTQGEVSKVCNHLENIWPDLEYCSTMPFNPSPVDRDWFHEKYNSSLISMISGHSVAIYRKITAKDLQTPYKQIEKKVFEITDDKEHAESVLRKYAHYMAEYLQVSVDRYKRGSFKLNDQMIKRLHLKINSKTKNK